MLDILIKHGTVVDGTQQSRCFVDIGIADGEIKVIGKDLNLESKEAVNATGDIVTPGFIDIHSHSDLSPFFTKQKMQSKLYQGITLEIVGNCGISCLPVNNQCRNAITQFIGSGLELPLNNMVVEDDSISDYVRHIQRCPAATNVGVLIGHGTLRGCVMGFGMRRPTAEELQAMAQMLDRELSRGAFGMSLGLIYPPSSFGDFDEFVVLAKVLKKHDAILTVHMRSESSKIFEALEEMLEVAKASKVHLEISHLKLIGKAQWHRADELLNRIKKAREDGINVTCDQYPYLATSTNIAAMVPGWAQDGGTEAMCKRLQVPEKRLLQDIKAEMERRGGSNCVLVNSTHGKLPQYEGQTLDKIAEDMGIEPELAVVKLLVATNGGVPCDYFCLAEDDMLNIMREKFVSVGSDGYALTYDKAFLGVNPHPRSFGTFPRFLQTIRETGILSLEDGIYKITGLPAKVLGIKDRGILNVGQKADITIFDYAKVLDKSTYMNSMEKPEGIKVVIIEGKVALRNGEQVGSNIGKVVLHTKY